MAQRSWCSAKQGGNNKAEQADGVEQGFSPKTMFHGALFFPADPC
jgi:hypothetical protein